MNVKDTSETETVSKLISAGQFILSATAPRFCPWCGSPIVHVTIRQPEGYTWACPDGCNP